MPLETRLNIYYALSMPYFNYCGHVWGNIWKGISDKLQQLHNSAARIIRGKVRTQEDNATSCNKRFPLESKVLSDTEEQWFNGQK